MIREARADEIDLLREIELAAGRMFAAIGMDEIAHDEPLPAAELREFQRDGRAWVATEQSGRPVAYLIAKWVDGLVHVEQVSVDPAYAGRGLGRDLIEQVARWARERGSAALTLTTFADVAWNAPYYQRLGFRRLAPGELTPGLRRIRAEEAAHGLDRWPRVVMRRDLAAGFPLPGPRLPLAGAGEVRVRILSQDRVGVVDALGEGVTGLEPGDRVRVADDRTSEEYVVLPRHEVIRISPGAGDGQVNPTVDRAARGIGGEAPFA